MSENHINLKILALELHGGTCALRAPLGTENRIEKSPEDSP